MSPSKHNICSENSAPEHSHNFHLAYLHQVLNIDLLLLSPREGHKELGKHALHLEGLQDQEEQAP